MRKIFNQMIHLPYFYLITYSFLVVIIALLPAITRLTSSTLRSPETNNTVADKHSLLSPLENTLAKADTPAATLTQVATNNKTSYNSGNSAVFITASYVNSGPTITINGHTLDIVNVGNTMIDSGNHVNRIGHLLYGHNYASVFGGIASSGSFTISENGASQTYYVQGSITLTKEETQNYMNSLVYNGAFRGGHYAYILITCAGTLYGGGDASHRTLVFAS